MGGIIGALIGRHLAHSEDQRQKAQEFVLAPVASYLKDPANSQYTPERVEQSLAAGMKMGYFPKEFKAVIGPMLEEGKQKWQAARNLEAMNQLGGSIWGGKGGQDPGTNRGVPTPTPEGPQPSAPAMPPMPDAAAAAPPPSSFNPLSMMGSPATPPPQVQQRPAAPPMPLIPFANGAGTGPAPQPDENPGLRQGSLTSVNGFGGPAVTAPAPVTPIPAARPAPDERFWVADRSPIEIGTQKGQVAAAEALPTAQQTNRLALEQEEKIAQQERVRKIAEQQRMLNIIKSDPNYAKLNPLQQQEVQMRVMGVQGAMSNYQRPLNLPQSAIPGSSFPPGSLTVNGTPIEANKWYRQQQANDGSNDVRGVETTPLLKETRVLTEKGPVIVFTDPLAQISKVIREVDKSPITDPALLETVKNAMTSITTVDAEGKPTTLRVASPSRSQKRLPGDNRSLPALPDAGGAAPAAAPRSGGAPVAAVAPGVPVAGGGRAYPKPLTAATQRSAEFAQSMQQHIPAIERAIVDLEKTGDLGMIAGRWNEFKAGGLGNANPNYVILRDNADMFDSALQVVHQTRGKHILEHFKSLADAGKMTPEALKAAFGVLKEWTDTYANMGKGRPGAVNTNPMETPPKVNRPMSDYEKK